jgi:Lipocalin-like domain
MEQAMKLILALAVATSYVFPPGFSYAEDAISQLKPVSWLTRFDRGDTVEPFGPNPKGRLVLTPDSHWIIILTGANRKPAKTIEEKAALLDTMLAYSSKYTVEGDKITIHVDMSSNEIRANQDQTRFFRIEGNKLTIRTPEIVSAVRPGQKAVGTITFERE